ncbi:MAG TPA: hypothetical protein VJX67_17475 [Blastocatellia bacterium]|nr:hypothetical protein [Blastocatellia bacterium]
MKTFLAISPLLGLLLLPPSLVPAARAQRHHSVASASRQNSWKGITPLVSSTADVARMLSKPEESLVPETSGPYQVDGGEVTFSFVTASLARIYHAPESMVGKVFTVYFTPAAPMDSSTDAPRSGFKRCVDPMDPRFFYYVSNDGGLAYQVRKASGQVEMVIYQPLHEEIKRLRVNATCVF